jgi:hypothetical protein
MMTDVTGLHRRPRTVHMLKRPWVFGAILVMQTLCAVFFCRTSS